MKVSVLGCGNLGHSIIEGFLKSGVFEASQIIGSDPDKEKLKEIEKLKVETTTDNKKAVKKTDIIFLAVKPSLVSKVLDELTLSDEKLLVSFAAGVSTNHISKHTKARIIRVMPNICGRVAEMASAYTLGPKTNEEDEKLVRNILNKLGETCKVEEKQMNTITGLSGSGPAYVFLFIKALKEAAEELGLPEKTAFKLAAQTVKGSSALVLDSDKNLEELIDIVCSPKGTTIEGMKVLRKKETKEALKEAVKAATERAEELSK